MRTKLASHHAMPPSPPTTSMDMLDEADPAWSARWVGTGREEIISSVGDMPRELKLEILSELSGAAEPGGLLGHHGPMAWYKGAAERATNVVEDRVQILRTLHHRYPNGGEPSLDLLLPDEGDAPPEVAHLEVYVGPRPTAPARPLFHASGEAMDEEAEAAFQEALERHEARLEAWEQEVQQRRDDLSSAREVALEEIQEERQAIEEARAAYREGGPRAVANYFRQLLIRSPLPPWIDVEAPDVRYDPEGRRLVVERGVPSRDPIPAVKSYEWIEYTRSFREDERPPEEVAALHQELVAALALRAAREVFALDEAEHVDAVVVSNLAENVSEVTGRDEQECVATLHVTRGELASLRIDRVRAAACFDYLGGRIAIDGRTSLERIEPVITIRDLDQETEEETPGEEVTATELADVPLDALEAWIKRLFATLGYAPETRERPTHQRVQMTFRDDRPIVGRRLLVDLDRRDGLQSAEEIRRRLDDLDDTTPETGRLLATLGRFSADAGQAAEAAGVKLVEGDDLIALSHARDVRPPHPQT